MSWQQQDDNCPGCQPVLCDLDGKPLPVDSREMVAINGVWAATTPEERQAFHRVTCQDSRELNDMLIIRSLTSRIERALGLLFVD